MAGWTGKLAPTRNGHVRIGSVYHAAFSPNGEFLATAGSRPCVRMLHLPSLQELWTRSVADDIQALLWAGDSSALSVVDDSGHLARLDARSGDEQACVRLKKAPGDSTWVLAESGDVISCPFGGPARRWDASTGRIQWKWQPRRRRLTGELVALDGGERIAVVSDTPAPTDDSPLGVSRVHVLDTSVPGRGAKELTLPEGVNDPHLALAADGQKLWMTRLDGEEAPLVMQSIDLPSLTMGEAFEVDAPTGVISCAPSHVQDRPLAIIMGSQVLLCDSHDGRVASTCESRYAQSVRWSPDGRYLLVDGPDAALLDATDDLEIELPAPISLESHRLADVYEMTQRGEIHESQLVDTVRKWIDEHALTDSGIAKPGTPLRVAAVAQTAYFEHLIDWDGLACTCENYGTRLPLIAQAYEQIGLEGVAHTLTEIHRDLQHLVKRSNRSDFFPLPDPFNPLQAKLNDAGLAASDERRARLVWELRDELTRFFEQHGS